MKDDGTAGFLPLVGGEVLHLDPLDRIATALERIADAVAGSPEHLGSIHQLIYQIDQRLGPQS